MEMANELKQSDRAEERGRGKDDGYDWGGKNVSLQ